VVLGAGGAARAVVVALADAGAPAIRLINRTREKAEALRELAPDVMQVVDWEARESAVSGARLLVNTTSLGMVGQPPLTIDLRRLPREALVYDIVYRPLETDLLATARARGNKVVEGLGMLLFQARPGFRLWFGREPEVTDELRRIVLEAAA
jgi:shikimate dehydrogenase